MCVGDSWFAERTPSGEMLILSWRKRILLLLLSTKTYVFFSFRIFFVCFCFVFRWIYHQSSSTTWRKTGPKISWCTNQSWGQSGNPVWLIIRPCRASPWVARTSASEPASHLHHLRLQSAASGVRTTAKEVSAGATTAPWPWTRWMTGLITAEAAKWGKRSWNDRYVIDWIS